MTFKFVVSKDFVELKDIYKIYRLNKIFYSKLK